MQVIRVCLTTGSRKVISENSKSYQQAADIGDWIQDLLWRPKKSALPKPLNSYEASVANFEGGLVFTVYRPTLDNPILTFAVARRANHGRPLWRVVSALTDESVVGDTAPPKPWCAFLWHPGEITCPAIEEFAMACAWYWVTMSVNFNQRRRRMTPNTVRVAVNK